MSEAPSSLRLLRPVAAPQLRLICFPYAGSGATVFHRWPSALPAHVEIRAVQLPGRQERLREAPLTRVTAITERIHAELARLPPLPALVYGHSFGGLLAYEFARSLRATKAPPLSLVVGAQRAPQLGRMSTPIHQLPESAFLHAIHLRYGTPLSVLQSRELMELALPSLRGDFEALETYSHVTGEPLDFPLTVLRGRRDSTTPAPDVAAWSELARGAVRFDEVDGGHFFVDSHASWVLEHVARAIGAIPATA